jgi:hypothetical protein
MLRKSETVQSEIERISASRSYLYDYFEHWLVIGFLVQQEELPHVNIMKEQLKDKMTTEEHIVWPER